jgi:hypothetical protein
MHGCIASRFTLVSRPFNRSRSVDGAAEIG